MQGSSLFPHHEYQKYKMLYSEVSQDKVAISYRDFVSVLKQIKIFDSKSIQRVLEKIRKETKNRTGDDAEAAIEISEKDYFTYLKQIEIEQNKLSNEGSTEFKRLFDLLSQNGESVSKAKIKAILDIYGISVDDSFFSSVPKKDNLSFEDFCCLFKSEHNTDIYIRTVSKNFFEHSDDIINSKNNVYTFPLIVIKK